MPHGQGTIAFSRAFQVEHHHVANRKAGSGVRINWVLDTMNDKSTIVEQVRPQCAHLLLGVQAVVC